MQSSFNAFILLVVGVALFMCDNARFVNAEEGKAISPEEQKRIQEQALLDLQNGVVIKTFNSAEEILALEPTIKDWEIPFNFSRRFIVYLSGYDYDDKPVWVGELGKWDLQSVAESSPEEVAAFEKYFLYLAINVLKSIKDRSTPDNPVNGASVMIDYEGVRIEQALSIPAIRLLLKLARQYRKVIVDLLGDAFIFNVNAVAQVGINLTRPLFAILDDRVEVYGSNKERWMPFMRKKYPLDAIPSWYGGKKDYKPLKILG